MYDYTSVIKNVYDIVNDFEINLTEDDILDLIKIENRWPQKTSLGFSTLEVITEWSVKNTDEMFDSRGRLIYDVWKKYYDYGFTTILVDVLDLTQDLRNLRKELSKIAGYMLSANFYLTKGSTNHRVSFGSHYHEYDVIVKTIYGKCKWQINHEYIDVSDSVIYIPAGTNHSVVECEDKKLSLTINLGC